MNTFNTSLLVSNFTSNINKIDIRQFGGRWAGFTLGLLLWSFVCGCSALESSSRTPSPEVQRFINKHHIDAYTIDVSLLPRWTATPSIPKRSRGEMYRLPQEHVSLEAFIFDIYYDRAQQVFWVKRTSPAASLEENYGPVKLSELP